MELQQAVQRANNKADQTEAQATATVFGPGSSSRLGTGGGEQKKPCGGCWASAPDFLLDLLLKHGTFNEVAETLNGRVEDRRLVLAAPERQDESGFLRAGLAVVRPAVSADRTCTPVSV
jgi:hypothetical protein